jgi:drug/metabolite transporter (DMT)-like permease
MSPQQHHDHQDNARYINAFSLSQAAGYVLSGCSQPLLMQSLSDSGLANAKAQLYMFFYYLAPALILVPLVWRGYPWPSSKMIWKAIGIALFDTVAASMNYAGATMAGPTIFAIVYSSVTIWTAVFSRICLGRTMNARQWASVAVVFCGLTLTATDSLQHGSAVIQGCALVVVGSAAHAMTYILCEAIMTVGEETLTVPQNCGIQSTLACCILGLWQLVYTIPNWQDTIGTPVNEAGTTVVGALGMLLVFALMNWIHSITFYETLIHFPGGATSAGVMKGLQAVLVFCLTHLIFCGRTGGDELCFTLTKFVSLLTVVGGVISYGVATQQNQQQQTVESSTTTSSSDY